MDRHGLTVLVGVPGIGKTAYAADVAEAFGHEHCSLDEVRAQHAGDPLDLGADDRAVPDWLDRIRAGLAGGVPVIADSTGIDAERRRTLREIAARMGVACHAVAFTDIDLAELWNARRPHPEWDWRMREYRLRWRGALDSLGGEGYESVDRVSVHDPSHRRAVLRARWSVRGFSRFLQLGAAFPLTNLHRLRRMAPDLGLDAQALIGRFRREFEGPALEAHGRWSISLLPLGPFVGCFDRLDLELDMPPVARPA